MEALPQVSNGKGGTVNSLLKKLESHIVYHLLFCDQACVSNPADALISELKKTKSNLTPQQAITNMLERNGIASFFVGLPLRMVFYSLIASMTFVVYDFVRFLLGIGQDDLKLYLDVLGGSLGTPSLS